MTFTLRPPTRRRLAKEDTFCLLWINILITKDKPPIYAPFLFEHMNTLKCLEIITTACKSTGCPWISPQNAGFYYK